MAEPDAIALTIQAWADSVLVERAAALETVCEAALQSGRFGVLVIDAGVSSWSAEVSPDVPYGQIYERRDRL